MNYYVNKIDSSLPELVNLLKTVEPYMRKDQESVMLVDNSNSSKKKKAQMKLKKKKNNPTKAQGSVKKKKNKSKETPTKGSCFHYGKVGH